jgi:hypothetical protein
LLLGFVPKMHTTLAIAASNEELRSRPKLPKGSLFAQSARSKVEEDWGNGSFAYLVLNAAGAALLSILYFEYWCVITN